MRVPRLACTLLLLVGACAGEGPWIVGERESAIVNGVAHSGHPAVGLLSIDGGGLCTATLIGKRTVLTAAHCIGGSHTFNVGGSSYSGTKAVRHPNWNSYYLTNDIAIVVLGKEPPVTPSPISTTAPTLGMEITLVGFGVTSEYGSDSGVKRIAKNKVSSVQATSFAFKGSGGSIGSTCYGDSGGPAFATIGGVEVQIGVTSSGAQPCGTESSDTRVDAFAGWLSQAAGGDVTQPGAPPPPPDQPPADQTPPSVSISSPIGGATVPLATTVIAVVTDNVKVTRAELLLDGGVVATLQAAPWQFPVSLTPGAHSLQVNGYDAANNKGAASVTVTASADGAKPPATPDPEQPQEPARGEFGAACSRPQDCNSGLCAEDPAAQGKYCTQACQPGGAECPSGAACLQAANSQSHVCGAPMHNLPVRPPGSDNGLDGDAESLVGTCSVPARAPALAAALPMLLPIAVWLLGGLSPRRWRRRPAPR